MRVDIYFTNGKYSIDTEGRVYNNRSNKELKGSIDKHGYRRVTLPNNRTKNCKQFPYKVHLLMRDHFMPYCNYNNVTINHIDENKTNNDISNLELCSRGDNVKAWFNNRRDEGVFKYQNKKKSNFVRKKINVNINGKEFESIHSATKFICDSEGKKYNTINREIRRILNGERGNVIYDKYVIN